MVHVVEETSDIGLYYVPITPVLEVESKISDRLLRAPIWSVGIAAIQKIFFVDRRQYLGEGADDENEAGDSFDDIEPGDELVIRTIQALGLPHEFDDEDTLSARQVLRLFNTAHARAERAWTKAALPEPLATNIMNLSKTINLSESEQSLLGFVVLLNQVPLLEDVTDLLDSVAAKKRVYRVLAAILGCPEQAIHRMLSQESVLGRTGIIAVGSESIRGETLQSRIDLFPRQLADKLMSPGIDPLALFKDVFEPAQQANLTLPDYGHLSSKVQLVRSYLKSAIESGQSGANLFFYGPPGTGKTELGKALASDLKVKLITISVQDEEGDPMRPMLRLRALRCAQELYRDQKVLLLFDEAEDVFMGDSWFNQSAASKHKGWMNRYLETNPVPVVWVSNSIHGLDHAFVRRFDWVMKIAVPPLSKRREIAEKLCGDLVDSRLVERIAASSQVAPAVIERAAMVMRRALLKDADMDPQEAMLSIVNGTLEGQGMEPIRLSDSNALPVVYDPGLITADCDLRELAEGIARFGSARICFYGPPGTGKTAYARWLSEQLDRPLLLKRASDLISKYVGGTEQKLAEVFHEAEQDKAVLLVDEIDSFLQDRRKANRSWEITQVNEMLTQMEAFSGVFIASTNLMDDLDQAALRRFDIKVLFGYLTGEQAGKLLRRWCGQLGMEAPTQLDQRRLQRLDVLTPGDFATVARQHRFKPFGSAMDMVNGLAVECGMKDEGKRRRIGFV